MSSEGWNKRFWRIALKLHPDKHAEEDRQCSRGFPKAAQREKLTSSSEPFVALTHTLVARTKEKELAALRREEEEKERQPSAKERSKYQNTLPPNELTASQV